MSNVERVGQFIIQNYFDVCGFIKKELDMTTARSEHDLLGAESIE